MDFSETRFEAHNLLNDFQQPEDISEYFDLSAPANSTLWRKPLSGDEVSAPMVLTRLQESLMVAEVTVTAEMEVEWDQAGLVIFAGMSPCNVPDNTTRGRRGNQHGYVAQPGKWLKAGIGLADEDVGVATAVALPGCGPDWSFAPLFSNVETKTSSFRRSSLRVKLERVVQDLWVWYRIPESHAMSSTGRSPAEVSRDWKKAREVSEFFTGVEVKSGIWVGCYASRPLEMDDGDGRSELFVEFEELSMI